MSLKDHLRSSKLTAVSSMSIHNKMAYKLESVTDILLLLIIII